MKKSIFQLVHTLSYGDAISGEVLALDRCFKMLGVESEIFAMNVHPLYKSQARDYREFPKNVDGEVVLHYSLGSPLNDLYRSLSHMTRALIFHNLTPSRWFLGVNPRIVRDIENGVRELPELCGVSDRLIADSPFNAGELKGLGFHADVLPLPFDPERWNVERNDGIRGAVTGAGGIHVLHVGRLAPNKCVEDIIKTFYFLHHKIEKRSTLWLAGIDIDTELYSFALKRLARELGLEDSVRFVGCLADSELRALYETCSVYLCMSEHEGFCVPLIEAMNFGLPTIAYKASAVPDTLGSGGVLVSEKNHPIIAELINELSVNQTLRERVIQAGRERVQELTFERFGERVRSLFSGTANPRVVHAGAVQEPRRTEASTT